MTDYSKLSDEELGDAAAVSDGWKKITMDGWLPPNVFVGFRSRPDYFGDANELWAWAISVRKKLGCELRFGWSDTLAWAHMHPNRPLIISQIIAHDNTPASIKHAIARAVLEAGLAAMEGAKR